MDIPTAITAISGALTVVKQLRDIDKDYDRAALTSQMADIYNDLADVKMALTDARTEIHDRDQTIRELEKAIAEMQSGDACPICKKGNLEVASVKPHPTFGDMGLQEKLFRCSNPECNHSEQRMEDPLGLLNKG